MDNNQDVVILFEAPKIIPPEFRLYYDDQGKVLFYTCEKLEGNYITIDRQTFAEMRMDLRVIDGQISRAMPNAVVNKLMPADDEDATVCHQSDISIIVDTDYNGDIQKWKLNTYELR
jgi:hypothetical protein